jgi:hypothetical protein
MLYPNEKRGGIQLHYYKHNKSLLITKQNLGDNFKSITESVAQEHQDHILIINLLEPAKSRRSFSTSDSDLLFNLKEDLNILKIGTPHEDAILPIWLSDKIKNNPATVVNSNYPNWWDILNRLMPNQSNSLKKWKVNVIGLGDVGGTLVTGLRLLGGDVISAIGIYDKDENKIKRWEFEAAQILSPSTANYPEIVPLNENQLFDCDMFVFCVSVGVPEVGKEQQDVRLIQFDGNSKIVGIYAKLARKVGFKGIFAVVSDPVDLLCKAAFNESNKNDCGQFDFLGLASDQIRGYGLGVMNARACYYAKKTEELKHYLDGGRAFGPHGEGLIIADSIEKYNEELSNWITSRTKVANLDVRATGFKPYVAPALSSGALSLLATIKGEWHYSATFIGGTFFGAKNRLTESGIELERNDLPDPLFNKLIDTYNYLRSIYD